MVNSRSKKNILSKCKKIKLVIADVDGVLTDGGMFFSQKGEFLKKFNTRDGMGVELLSRKGIRTVFVSKENSKIVQMRAKKLNISGCYVGVKKKELLLPKICKKFRIKKHEIAYIGDDVNDLKIMNAIGLSITPKDGMEPIKKISDYVCKLNGGEGVFREISNLILSTQTSK